MNRWYRQSLPPRLFFVAAFFILVVLADLTAIIGWLVWGRLLDNDLQSMTFRPFLAVAPVLTVFAAGVIAICRIVRFPSEKSDFDEWLATTPWQSSQRTPFGPWHPVLQDIIPLGILSLMAAVHVGLLSWARGQMFGATVTVGDLLAHVSLAAVSPIVIFIFIWALCGWACAWKTWNGSVFVPLLSIALLIHLGIHASPEIALITAAVLIVVGIVAVWQRLKKVLYELPARHLKGLEREKSSVATSHAYLMLSPKLQKPAFINGLEYCRPKAIAFGVLLLAWLTLIPFERKFLPLLPIGIGLLAVFRIAVCCERANSHLGVAARWATRKFIIPEYDRVWVPSIVMVLVSSGFALLGYIGILPLSVGVPLSLVVPVVIGLLAGPDYETWSLTAPVSYSMRRGPQRRRQNV